MSYSAEELSLALELERSHNSRQQPYLKRINQQLMTRIENLELQTRLKALESQQANLENRTESIDVPGGKESMYKHRGSFTLPNGQKKEITGKTINDLLQKAADATAAWFEENSTLPHLPAQEPEKRGPTFREWSQTLIEKHTLRLFERHQDMLYLEKWIYPFFGDKIITEVKHTDCQAFADYLAKTPSKKTGNPLSRKTAKHILDLTKSILIKAEEDDIISKNPMRGIANRCKAEDQKFRYLSENEQVVYLKTLSKVPEKSVQLYAAICIATGLRPEETIALTWDDYHTEEEIPYFTINKAAQTQNLPKGQKGSAIKEPKTKAGKRRVPVMCPQAVTLLNEARQADGYIIRGLRNNSDRNAPISGHQKKGIDDKLNTYLQAEGMKLRTTGYDCRHTMATLLDKTGAAQKSIKYIMGHAGTDFTLRTYVENDWVQVKKDAQKVSDYFSGLSESLSGTNYNGQSNLLGA